MLPFSLKKEVRIQIKVVNIIPKIILVWLGKMKYFGIDAPF